MTTALRRTTFTRLVAAAAWMFLLSMVVGCGPKYVITAAAYDQGGLAINVNDTKLDDGKLQLRLTFINKTGKMMMVDRDQMQVRVADGTMIPRYAGSGWMGIRTPGTHVIAAGVSHPVHVDFMVGDRVGPAALVLTGVIVDGTQLQLPEYPLNITSAE
jgi:hypothetical protein